MLFAALVPKAGYCESPCGLTASLLTSSLLSFFPLGLLRLHCMTFSPAPLKPWVSGEPIWPEVSLSKASRHSTCQFFFGFISSPLLSPHTPPARPLRAKPSSTEASWFPLSGSLCKAWLVSQLILEFRGRTVWRPQPELLLFAAIVLLHGFLLF